MSTNNTTSLATVADVTGKVWAVAEDGTRHLLQTGDAVYEGECILTESGGQVVLKAANGADLKVTESKEVALSGGLFERSENTFSLDLRGLIAATEGTPVAPAPSLSAVLPVTPLQSISRGDSVGSSFINVGRVNEFITAPVYQFSSFTGNYNSQNDFRSSSFDALLEGRATYDERIVIPLEPLFSVREPLLLQAPPPVVSRISLLPLSAGTTIVIPDTNGGSTPGNETVYEAALVDGSNPGSGYRISSIFTITAPDGLATLIVGGSTISAGSLAGSAAVPVTIVTEYGTLVINGYAPNSATGGGVVSYTYTLTDNTLEHGPGNNGANTVLDSLSITVTDIDGDSSTAILDIGVVDDLPIAHPDEDTVTADSRLTATGNVVNGATPSGENDMIGADKTPVDPVTGVGAGNDTGVPAVGNVAGSVLGSYGSVVIGADGSYTYTLDNNNKDVQDLTTGVILIDTFVYTITDADGDQSTTTLTIRILGNDAGTTIDIPDNDPDTSADEKVFEAALFDGSNPPSTLEAVSSTFTITAPDGVATLSVGGTTISAGALADSATVPVTIVMEYGSLVINGYTPNSATGGGVVHYTYTLADNTLDHGYANNGPNTVLDSVSITVTDTDGDSSTGILDIGVVDDLPTARPDADTVTKDIDLIATGNVVNGNDPSSENDMIGADKTPVDPVTGVGAGNDTGVPAVGNVAGSVLGSYGSVVIGADGSYTYTLDNRNADVQALRVGGSLIDLFVYTITDADGDQSTTTLTIRILGNDTVPTIDIPDNDPDTSADEKVFEAALFDGSNPPSTQEVVNSTFTIKAPDGLASITIVDGSSVQHVLTEAQLSGAMPLTSITTKYGTLLITGYTPNGLTGGGVVSYTYTLSDNTLDHGYANNGPNTVLDSVSITITDTDGDSATGILDIGVVDDLPIARQDADTVIKDTLLTATGNVVNGGNPVGENDTIGADNTSVNPVTGVGVAGSGIITPVTISVPVKVVGSYGSVVIGADGSYTYTLDNSNVDVHALTTGQTLTDTFVYTITDADGDQSTTTLAITIQGRSGVPPTIEIIDHNGSAEGDESVYEAALPVVGSGIGIPLGSGDDVNSTFKITAMEGLASITIVDTRDGTEHIIDKTALENSATGHISISAKYGTLEINGYTPDPATGGGVVRYTYTLSGNTLNHAPGDDINNIVPDNFTITVTDELSLTAIGQLGIAVFDDLPVAQADADTVTKVAKVTAIGNVVNGGNPVGENDTIGADNSPVAPVTGVRVGSDTTTQAVGNVAASVLGSYGSVTIQANGDYSYTLDNSKVSGLQPTDSPLTDAFVYTITDADGDKSTTTLTITIYPQGAVVGNVQEDALSNFSGGSGSTGYIGGLEGSKTTIASDSIASLVPEGTTGTVTFSLQTTGLTALGLKSKGESLQYAVTGSTNNILTASNGSGRNVFTLVLSGTTATTVHATYTFTLLDQLDHVTGLTGTGDSATFPINLSSAIAASNGSSVPIYGTLIVTVENDVPVASSSTLTEMVYEDALSTTVAPLNLSDGNTDGVNKLKTVSGSLSDLFTSGADETTVVANSLIYSMLSGGSGPVLNTIGGAVTSLGKTVFYTVDSTGLIMTGYADENGNSAYQSGTDRVVFTLTITAAGGYTFALNDQLDHATTSGDTGELLLNLAPVLIATDFDGDQATRSDGFTIKVQNDVPVNTEANVTGAVREDALTLANSNSNSVGNNSEGGVTTVASDSLANLVAVGADEPVTFSLQVGSLAALGLKSKGESLQYVVTGTTNNILTASNGSGRNVFTLELSGSTTTTVNATYTFTLLDQLDHTSGVGDSATFRINLSSAIKATDRDGDSITVASGFTITVENDVPVATSGGSEVQKVYEDALTGGNGEFTTPAQTVTVSGVLSGLFTSGADEGLTYSLQAVDESDATDSILKTVDGAVVKSLGANVRYSVSGLVITGYVDVDNSGSNNAGDRELFTLTITNQATGAYTFLLKGQLDHGAGSTDSSVLALNLSPALVATDFDGDAATLTTGFTINVENDVPKATNDTASVGEGGLGDTASDSIYDSVDAAYKTTGNLLTNDLPGADKDATAKGMTLISFTYKNETGVTGTTASGTLNTWMDTKWGAIKVLSDGSFYYMSDPYATHPSANNLSDTITYVAEDADHNSVSATCTISLTDTESVFLGTVASRDFSDTALSVSQSSSIAITQGKDPKDLGFLYVGGLAMYSINQDVTDFYQPLFGDLTSNGRALTYTFTDASASSTPYYRTLTATTTVGNIDVFKLEIIGYVNFAGSPESKFTLYQPLDHIPDFPGSGGDPTVGGVGGTESQNTGDPSRIDLVFTLRLKDTNENADEKTTDIAIAIYDNGNQPNDTLLFSGVVRDGLTGYDTVQVNTTGFTYNFTSAFGAFRNIEYIDLLVDTIDVKQTTVTDIKLADLQAMTVDHPNKLTILGDSNDHVSFLATESWAKAGTAVNGCYAYTYGGFTVNVQDGISVL